MFTILAFLGCGTVSGIIISWAMDMKTPKELLQGACGGMVTGLLMVMLLPR